MDWVYVVDSQVHIGADFFFYALALDYRHLTACFAT